MLATNILLFLVLVTSAAAILKKNALRVLEGSKVTEGEYTYVVVLVTAGVRGCSGSAIAPQWVLTAGHCSGTGALLSGQIIIYGDFTTRPKENSKSKKVLDVKKIREFKEEINLRHDIALCKIEPLKLKKYGVLSGIDYLSLIGKPARYIGGGGIIPLHFNGRHLIKLLKHIRTLPLHKGEALIVKCSFGPPQFREGYERPEHETRHAIICLRPKCSSRNSSAYGGDSGGPLLHKGKIVDVASSISHTGDKPNKLNLYTPVSIYLNWILNVVSNEDE